MSSSACLSDSVPIKIYENQKLSLDIGNQLNWIPHVRSPWTLESTKEDCSYPEDFTLPTTDGTTVCIWISNWKIEKQSGLTDENGWEYASRRSRFDDANREPISVYNLWTHRARRRLWYRLMQYQRNPLSATAAAAHSQTIPISIDVELETAFILKVQTELDKILSTRILIEDMIYRHDENPSSSSSSNNGNISNKNTNNNSNSSNNNNNNNNDINLLMQRTQKHIKDVVAMFDGVAANDQMIKKLKKDVIREQSALIRLIHLHRDDAAAAYCMSGDSLTREGTPYSKTHSNSDTSNNSCNINNAHSNRDNNTNIHSNSSNNNIHNNSNTAILSSSSSAMKSFNHHRHHHGTIAETKSTNPFDDDDDDDDDDDRNPNTNRDSHSYINSNNKSIKDSIHNNANINNHINKNDKSTNNNHDNNPPLTPDPAACYDVYDSLHDFLPISPPSSHAVLTYQDAAIRAGHITCTSTLRGCDASIHTSTHASIHSHTSSLPSSSSSSLPSSIASSSSSDSKTSSQFKNRNKMNNYSNNTSNSNNSYNIHSNNNNNENHNRLVFETPIKASISIHDCHDSKSSARIYNSSSSDDNRESHGSNSNRNNNNTFNSSSNDHYNSNSSSNYNSCSSNRNGVKSGTAGSFNPSLLSADNDTTTNSNNRSSSSNSYFSNRNGLHHRYTSSSNSDGHLGDSNSGNNMDRFDNFDNIDHDHDDDDDISQSRYEQMNDRMTMPNIDNAHPSIISSSNIEMNESCHHNNGNYRSNSNSNSHSHNQHSGYNDDDDDDIRDEDEYADALIQAQLIEQKLEFIDEDKVQQQLNEERALEIAQVRKGIVEVNEMFVDMSKMVLEQQIHVDLLNEHVDETHELAQTAFNHIRDASHMQTTGRWSSSSSSLSSSNHTPSISASNTSNIATSSTTSTTAITTSSPCKVS